MISRLITEERKKQLETFKYPDDILTYLDKMQEEHHYTDEEMEKDLGVALWKAYALNNSGSYSAFALSEKILKKVENEGFDTGVWCSRYSYALMCLRKFDESLTYIIHGTTVAPDYPWGWLQLARLYYKLNMINHTLEAISKGLTLVPGDPDFLAFKDDVKNRRDFETVMSRYIDG